MKRYILALTGASGMPYAISLLETLLQLPDVETHVIISESASKILALEADISVDFFKRAKAVYYQHEISAPAASGSWEHQGMIICPCSMASVAAISCGQGDNLIHRAADVSIKEKRQLILVPRETPLSQIHLQNMLSLAQAGAILMPACPGFYHKPKQLQELVNFVVARVLDHLNINHQLSPRWQEPTL